MLTTMYHITIIKYAIDNKVYGFIDKKYRLYINVRFYHKYLLDVLLFHYITS